MPYFEVRFLSVCWSGSYPSKSAFMASRSWSHVRTPSSKMSFLMAARPSAALPTWARMQPLMAYRAAAGEACSRQSSIPAAKKGKVIGRAGPGVSGISKASLALKSAITSSNVA